MELWGKGWSLSGQDTRNMEYLGMIVRNDVKYKYYRPNTGEILYDSEPIGRETGLDDSC